VPLRLNLDHFRARVLQDALTQAAADYWRHRARTFEDAAPRAGDYRGHATPDDLVAQAIRCKQLAENCRRHADLIAAPEPIHDDIHAALQESHPWA
jgi:hypothetical protein